jgi:hypothetical protein
MRARIPLMVGGHPYNPNTTATIPSNIVSFLVPKSTSYRPLIYKNPNQAHSIGLLTLEDWIPSKEPKSGENFIGVDRSVDPFRLAGVRFTQQNSSATNPIYDAVIDASSFIHREGYCPDTLFVDPLKFNQLHLEILVATAQAVPGQPISWFYIHTFFGKIKVYKDDDCPPRKGYMLTMNTWEYDPAFNLICQNPGANGVINFL